MSEGLRLNSILVPLDSSVLAEHALPTGAMLAAKAGAALHLVSVQEPLVTPYGMEFPALFLELRDEQREHLAQYLARASEAALRADAPTVRTALLDGIVARELGRYIQTEGIDLVVMTTHGRGGINRLWLGSVADRLLRTVRTPMLLLRPTDGGVPLSCRRILVALDGEIEEEVLDAALGLAALLPPATLVLTRIVEPPVPVVTRLAVRPARFGADWTERHEIEARNYLARLAERLRAPGRIIETQVLVGRPVAEEIVSLAHAIDADLIVMGTHGARGFERLLLGSVADKTTRISDVPLLIAPVRRLAGKEEPVPATSGLAHMTPAAVGTGLW